MSAISQRFLFASAPDSWGVLDYPGPSWEQSYETMLDEMVEAGYTGSELGLTDFSRPTRKFFSRSLKSGS